jgi:hypothetical protein
MAFDSLEAELQPVYDPSELAVTEMVGVGMSAYDYAPENEPTLTSSSQFLQAIMGPRFASLCARTVYRTGSCDVFVIVRCALRRNCLTQSSAGSACCQHGTHNDAAEGPDAFFLQTPKVYCRVLTVDHTKLRILRGKNHIIIPRVPDFPYFLPLSYVHTSCAVTHRHDDGGSKVLCSFGKLTQVYTTQQTRSPPASYSRA